jgi:V8-like Glu-specific endopeptidase
MKIKSLLKVFIITIFFIPQLLLADEGMWLLNLIEELNYSDMKNKGLKITAEQIYSINKSSMKDAIVMINDGQCSGYMVSNQGLMMTNHHCVLEYITDNSIKYNTDYVKYGFYAPDKLQELYNPNLRVKFLLKIEDVTDKALRNVTDDMTALKRDSLIKENIKIIKENATKGSSLVASVVPFYKGSQYILMLFEEYKDVRLVCAPPLSIGFFGGDADNWTWPRHVGDFAFLRIYMGPDGKPATYNKKKNIPYSPKYYLPFSNNGYQEGDFVMSIGYPGNTDRFMTSYGVQKVLDIIDPTIVRIRDIKLSILRRNMQADSTIALMYTSKYNRISNYWKYFMGQIEVMNRLKVIENKRNLEKDFTSWINADPQKKLQYQNVLENIQNIINSSNQLHKAIIYYNEAAFNGPDIISLILRFDSLYITLKNNNLPDDQKNAKIIEQSTKLKYYVSNYFYPSFNINVDKELFISLFQMIYNDLLPQYHPDIFKEISKNSTFALFADEVYNKSIFSSKNNIFDFLNNPQLSNLENDLGFKVTKSLYVKYKNIYKDYNNTLINLNNEERILLSGIREMLKDKHKFYPDANSTMRLTYGKIVNYTPVGGSPLAYYTTLDDMIARENPNNPEFTIDTKLKQLYKNKDFGTYAVNGKIPLCFISDLDVIGGCSGAPVLNANGEVIGIVFDINWEATSSQYTFDAEHTRCIATDIRFVMFYLDKYLNAQNIINELKII